MAARFIPRQQFPVASLTLPRTYFLGHHRQGLNKIKSMIFGDGQYEASSRSSRGRGPLGLGSRYRPLGNFSSLAMVDLVIECRDYRVPISSQNEFFEREIFAGDAANSGPNSVKRLIVYTKRDLGRETFGWNGHTDPERKRLEDEIQAKIVRGHDPLSSSSSTKVLFTDLRNRSSIDRILAFIRGHAQERLQRTGIQTGSRCVIVGLPNVGKSSLLNALKWAGARKETEEEDEAPQRKVARTGGNPGITRKVSNMVKIIDEEIDVEDDVHLRRQQIFNSNSESQFPWSTSSNSKTSTTSSTLPSPRRKIRTLAYIADTPGVFTPSPGSISPLSDEVPISAQSMDWNTRILHLALAGAIRDNLISPIILTDYLLFRLNLAIPNIASSSASASSDETPPSLLPIYTKYTPNNMPTNSVYELLTHIAQVTGKLRRQIPPHKALLAGQSKRQHQHEANMEAAATWFVQRWRKGELGRFMLDDVLQQLPLSHSSEVESSQGSAGFQTGAVLSLSQARRIDKRMRREQFTASRAKRDA